MRHGAAFYYICCDLRTSKTRSAWSSSNTQSGPAFLSPSPYALLKVTTVTFVSCDSFQEKFRKAYAYVYVLWTCFFPLHNTQWRSQHMQTAVYAAGNQCSSFLLQWGVLSAASCQLNASLCKALCQWRIGSPRAVLQWLVNGGVGDAKAWPCAFMGNMSEEPSQLPSSLWDRLRPLSQLQCSSASPSALFCFPILPSLARLAPESTSQSNTSTWSPATVFLLGTQPRALIYFILFNGCIVCIPLNGYITVQCSLRLFQVFHIRLVNSLTSFKSLLKYHLIKVYPSPPF